MAKKFVYPPKESVVFINEVISIMSNRKADQHKLLRADSFIDAILNRAKNVQGDVYDKAAVILRGIITTHGFASGNKRTGFIVASYFLSKNGGRIRIRNFNKAERIIRNIRNLEIGEIADWLRTGDIDETKIP